MEDKFCGHPIHKVPNPPALVIPTPPFNSMLQNKNMPYFSFPRTLHTCIFFPCLKLFPLLQTHSLGWLLHILGNLPRIPNSIRVRWPSFGLPWYPKLSLPQLITPSWYCHSACCGRDSIIPLSYSLLLHEDYTSLPAAMSLAGFCTLACPIDGKLGYMGCCS